MKRVTHALSMASILMLGGLHLAAVSTHAQEGTGYDSDPPLYDNLGDYSRSVTTDSELAQAYFDQGLRLAYSFARADAARSFRAAQGLQQSLEAQGRTAEARQAEEAFQEAWQRADIWLPASRF